MRMNERQKKITGSVIYRLCPARHILAAGSAALIGLYFALRGEKGLMNAWCEGVVYPFQREMARLCSYLPFSAAELLYAVFVAGMLAYVFIELGLIVGGRGRAARLYKLVVTLIAAALAVYASFCALWGVAYHAPDFEDKSGLVSRKMTVDELYAMDAYFALLANEYGAAVSRDKKGLFAEDEDSIFDQSADIYKAAEAKFGSLKGQALIPKKMVFSRVMSYLNFTGLFFPLTGEANINTDPPANYLPVVIAHELAHQRGIAAEDEANFVAIMACLESGNPVYCYSAALMGYAYLGNALYGEDPGKWEAVCGTLSEEVRLDLQANSEYWKKFETKISEASEAVYEGFLQSHGQTEGMKSYGACIDLLAAYYLDDALSALSP